MAKRGRRSKKNKIDINVAVVALVLISILLMILIYTKSGYLGETLSPMLGGIIGFIKYIIPIGMYIIHMEKKLFISVRLMMKTFLNLLPCMLNQLYLMELYVILIY